MKNSKFSDNDDKNSGVKIKHIYSDNHNLECVKYFKGMKIGAVNYKMHFNTFESEDVSNTLRPEKLILNVYNVKEPYNVFHSGRINLQYSATSFNDVDNASFEDTSSLYSFRFFLDRSSKGIFLIEKGLNFDDKFNNSLELNVNLMRSDERIFNAVLFKDEFREYETNVSKLLIFNKNFNSDTLFFYDEELKIWRPTGVHFVSNEYLKYSSTRVDKSSDFKWEKKLKYSTSPYGFDEVSLIDIIDKSAYNIYACLIDDSINSFWDEPNTYNDNFKLITNIQDIKYYGLGSKPINGLMGVKLEVKTISNAESNDLNLINELINIVQRIEIFPNNDLNNGISINYQFNEFEIKLYIPFKTNQDINLNYLNEKDQLKSYRFFNMDFKNIVVSITKEYDDRTEYLGNENYLVLESLLTNVMELN